MKILIIDDHIIFREGLRVILEARDTSIVTRIANGTGQSLRTLPRIEDDMILLNWQLQDLPGTEAITVLKQRAGSARIAVLSTENRIEIARQAIDAGAVGFISKSATPETLIDALYTMIAGEIYLPPNIPRNMALDQHASQDRGRLNGLRESFPSLTQRQVTVLGLLLKGKKNKQIARQLLISEQTVKSHVTVIFRLLSVQSRAEVLYLCARQGIPIE